MALGGGAVYGGEESWDEGDLGIIDWRFLSVFIFCYFYGEFIYSIRVSVFKGALYFGSRTARRVAMTIRTRFR